MSTSTGEYIITSSGTVDADAIISSTNDLRDLLSIEFVNDEDNIELHQKIVRLLYQKIIELEYTVSQLTSRRV